MSRKKVADVFNRNGTVAYVAEDDNALQVAKQMRQFGVSAVLVKNKQGIVSGIITERDLVVKMVALDKDAVMITAKSLMTSNPVAVRPESSLMQAVQLMTQKRIRNLPIVDTVDGKKEVVGVLSGRDIIARDFDELRKQLHAEDLSDEDPEQQAYDHLQ